MRKNPPSETYTLFADLSAEAEIPERGTHSRTIHADRAVKAVLFGFAAGETLSDHASSRPAILHVLEGRIELGLGEEKQEVGPGAWVHMPPRFPHSVNAITRAALLLLLLGPAGPRTATPSTK